MRRTAPLVALCDSDEELAVPILYFMKLSINHQIVGKWEAVQGSCDVSSCVLLLCPIRDSRFHQAWDRTAISLLAFLRAYSLSAYTKEQLLK
jgi:hypothetical protein